MEKKQGKMMPKLLDCVDLPIRGQRATWENAKKKKVLCSELMTLIYRDVDRKKNQILIYLHLELLNSIQLIHFTYITGWKVINSKQTQI